VGFSNLAEVRKDIATDELIEECYAILTTIKDRAFKDFYFAAGERDCIPAGYAMIYNHADDPNATYEFDSVHSIVVFRALRPIKCGEEIFTYYGTKWFDCRSLKVKKVPWWYKLKIFLRKHKPTIRLIVVFSICYLSLQLTKHFS
jgi:hypothetical protein